MRADTGSPFAEHAKRLSAMYAAERNIQRQDAMTAELRDIVAAFKSVSSPVR